MNKQQTAVEWLNDKILEIDVEFDMTLIGKTNYWIKRKEIIKQANKMFEQQKIEFAKLHVQRALKAVDEKATVTPIDHEEISKGSFQPIWGVDSESILTAYPLENIK